MSTVQIGFIWETCCHAGCNVAWGMTNDHVAELRRSRAGFYCPNGHRQYYAGKSDEEKLREAEAREIHLKDQLRAATRSEEAARSELLRVRSRIANGVCPCCNRSFDNVRRHMATKHPDFDAPQIRTKAVKHECSCGARFATYRGLRVHQGHLRPDDWDAPGKSRTSTWNGAHLTVVPS